MEKLPIRTIEDYLWQFPENVQIALEELREVVRGIAPHAHEQLYYQIPMFKYLGQPLVGFGAFKKHCSFFVMNTTVLDNFKADLLGYDYSGGTVHFQPDTPLPNDLVEKLVKAKMAINEAKIEKKKTIK